MWLIGKNTGGNKNNDMMEMESVREKQRVKEAGNIEHENSSDSSAIIKDVAEVGPNREFLDSARAEKEENFQRNIKAQGPIQNGTPINNEKEPKGAETKSKKSETSIKGVKAWKRRARDKKRKEVSTEME